MERNKPVKKFRTGVLSVDVWSNVLEIDGKQKTLYSVSHQRSYKDGEEWKNTTSLRMSDLPKIGILYDEAYKYLLFEANKEDSE